MFKGLNSWERPEHMKKILFAGDKEKASELVSITLGNQYQTFQAESGEQAIEIAKAEIPDLVIMDVMMFGEIDRFEAIRILKKDPKTTNCKILIISAKCQTTDVDCQECGVIYAIKAGANDYVIKPFNPSYLINKVEELLGL